MYKILFTGNKFSKDEILNLKKEGFEIIPADSDLNEKQLIDELKKVDVYIVGGKEVVSSKVVEEISKNIKLITNFNIGTGTIDMEATRKFHIPVTNALKVSTYSVAEFTVGLILTLNKRIFEFSNDTRNGTWNKMEMFDLKNKTVGIVGMGSIGTYTARILRNGFDMKVLYTDIVQKFAVEEEMSAKKVSLEVLLKESDFVSLHAPLNDLTRNMISKKELALMKPAALLVNTARAWLVNPDDLFNSLSNNQIAGATFDGFYSEPVDNSQPGSSLLELPDSKFILTPHTGYNVYENDKKAKRIAIENIRSVLSGYDCPNLIR